MRYLIYLILSLLSFHTVYAYQIGDVVVTKEGDKGVVFFVSQEKVLLVSLHNIGPVKFSTSEYIDELKTKASNTRYHYIHEACFTLLEGFENTQKIIALSDKYEFPILDSIAIDRGWFIPSLGEFVELVEQNEKTRDYCYYCEKIIDRGLQSIGGDSFYNIEYFTSTPDLAGIDVISYNSSGFHTERVRFNSEYYVRPIYQIDLKEDTTKKEVSYLWNTGSTEEQIQVTPKATTTYSVTATNTKNACMSTASHTIFVANSGKQEIADTICEGETYEQYGFSETETGDYTNTIANDTCTTDVVLHLTVAPKYKNEFNDEICQGEYYGKNGFSLTPFAKGQVHDTLTFLSNLGCDSMVILNLNVKPITYDTLFTRICQNEVYKDNDFDILAYQQCGLSYYTVEKTGENGCKNYYTLALQVDSTYQKTIVDKVFKDSTYTKYGYNLEAVTEAGTYSLNLKTANGCDSIVTLKLEVLPTYKQTEEQTICEGTTYTWDGQILSAAGTYTDSLKTKDGGDSIRTLTLTILPSIKTNLDVSICNGSNYTFGSKTLTEAGTYTDTLTAANGCDSIVTLNLILLPNYDQKEEHAICEGSTFTWGGQTLSEAGTYTDTLKTKDGCDSVRSLILSILPSKHSELTASICPNSSYSFGGKVLTEAGTYTDTLTAASGCDSILTLKLSILPTYNQVEETSICTGTTYTWEGQTLSTAGTYTDTLKTKDGCDSIRTLKLTILPTINTNLDVSICNGSSYTFGSKTLTEAGTYTDTLTAVGGCDSIVTLNLNLLPNYDQKEEHAICEGSTFTWGGQTLSEAGTYTDTLKTKDGCDSVRTLILSILPSKHSELTASICPNSSYSFGGKVLTEAGTFTDTLTAASGCDSIVTLKLTVSTVLHTIITDTTFKNYGYLFGDRRLYEPGTYTDTLVSVAGCDSIVTLNLYHKDHKTFTHNYDLCNEMKGHEGEDYPLIVHKTIQDTVENFGDDSDPYEIEIKQITYHNTKYVTLTDSICRGEQYVFGNQTLKQAGTYYDTIRSSCSCCDSLITTLHLNLIKAATNEISDTVCEGRSYTFGDESKTYDAGTYHLSVTEPSANGCDSTTLLTLNVLPSIRTQMWDAITIGESYNNYGFNVAEQYKTGTYTYSQTITGDEHCDSIITLNLVVNPMVDNKEIPTVFSPSNHDGVNDVFMEGYDVFIYDRYGNLICESDNGWDGKYRGKYADPGVYVYVVTLKDGQKKKGTIEVLKD